MSNFEMQKTEYPGRRYSRAKKRFTRNLETEKMISQLLDSYGHINGQKRFPVADMHFGAAKAGETACEAIAVYNVLRDLGRPVKLSEIIFCNEISGYLFAFGFFGTKIRKIGSLLKRYKVDYEVIKVPDFLNMSNKGMYTDGQIFIATVKNNARLPICSLHTFEMVFYNRQWIVYNRFNESDRATLFHTADDVLKNGKYTGEYYYIYKIVGLNNPQEII